MIKGLFDNSVDTMTLEMPCVDQKCFYETPMLEYVDASNLLRHHKKVTPSPTTLIPAHSVGGGHD